MDGPIRRFWFADNPVITAYLNGLSVSIPEIERFIVGAAKDAHRLIHDPKLDGEVATLIHEEEAHARVHDAYNDMLRAQGYKIERFEAAEHFVAETFNKRSVKTRLAVCACSEFFTAVFGKHFLMSATAGVPNIDERMRALWTWHAIEELDHRSVAFDLYLAHGGGYFRRTGLMLVLTVRWLLSHVLCSLYILFKSRARISLKQALSGLAFVLGPRGFYTSVALHWFAFFRPGFHPSKDLNVPQGIDRELHHIHIEDRFVAAVRQGTAAA